MCFLGATFVQTVIQQKDLRKKDIRQTLSLYNATTEQMMILAKPQLLNEEEKQLLNLLSDIADNLSSTGILKEKIAT